MTISNMSIALSSIFCESFLCNILKQVQLLLMHVRTAIWFQTVCSTRSLPIIQPTAGGHSWCNQGFWSCRLL